MTVITEYIVDHQLQKQHPAYKFNSTSALTFKVYIRPLNDTESASSSPQATVSLTDWLLSDETSPLFHWGFGGSCADT